MSFHEVRFPTNLSFGASGGPERRTEIVALASGFEERNTPWAQSLHRYDAGMSMRSLDDLETLLAFFEARQGQLFGFRWKDWADHKSCLCSEEPTFSDQTIGVGDGVKTVYQLSKTYRSGDAAYARRIAKPVDGSVVAGVGGSALESGPDFTVDPALGEITFTSPPSASAEVTAGFEFDVPVRFDVDRIAVSVASFQAGDAPDVPVVELRL